MSAGKYNITIQQGDDYDEDFTVKDDGVARDLSGYVLIEFLVYDRYSPTVPLLSLTDADGGLIVTAASGKIKPVITEVMTAAMDPATYENAVYKIRLTDDSATPITETILKGNFRVEAP
jgi:hypothetical protein